MHEQRLLVAGDDDAFCSAVVRCLLAESQFGSVIANPRHAPLTTTRRITSLVPGSGAQKTQHGAADQATRVLLNVRADASGVIERLQQSLDAIGVSELEQLCCVVTGSSSTQRSAVSSSDLLSTVTGISRRTSIIHIAPFTEVLAPVISEALSRNAWPVTSDSNCINFVCRNDAALATARLLSSPDEPKTDTMLLGPEPVSFATVAGYVEQLGATSLPLEIVEERQLPTQLNQLGYPPTAIQTMHELDMTARSGRFDLSNTAVQSLTHRPPTSVRAWLTAHKILWQPG